MGVRDIGDMCLYDNGRGRDGVVCWRDIFFIDAVVCNVCGYFRVMFHVEQKSLDF